MAPVCRFNEQSVREALDATCGNITHAAIVLNTSKTHAMRLLNKFSLSDYARELRRSVGRAATGTPKVLGVDLLC